MQISDVIPYCSLIIAACAFIGLLAGCLHFEMPKHLKKLALCGSDCIEIERVTSKNLPENV
jgi:hypothetical protein